MPPLRHAHPLRAARPRDSPHDVLVPELSGQPDGRSMTAIDVLCAGSRAAGWRCSVILRDGRRDLSTHQVRVGAPDLDRLAPAATDPTDLVTRSFGFLLERESPASILRSFDLLEIARYFPEYERTIRRNVG
jgi:hypothetical protein